MQFDTLWTDDRAVSPVVGVALLIAIAVILAAVIGAVVLGLGVTAADGPQASLQFEYDDGGDVLTITHTGGDALNASQIELRGDFGDSIDITEDLRSGESITVTVTLTDGQDASVVWMDPNSNDESVIATYSHNG